MFEVFYLSEIGESLGISRQAVYDNIHRSQKAMEDYEAKLGLVARYQSERKALNDAYSLVKSLRCADNGAVVDEILGRLSHVIGKGREVRN